MNELNNAARTILNTIQCLEIKEKLAVNTNHIFDILDNDMKIVQLLYHVDKVMSTY